MIPLSVQETADRIGVSRQQVWKWIDTGRIPTVEIAGRKFVERRHAKRPKRLPPGRKASG